MTESEIIAQLESMICWEEYCGVLTLPEEFVHKYQHKFNWRKITENAWGKERNKLVEKYGEYVVWDAVNYDKSVTSAFIQKHADKINWNRIIVPNDPKIHKKYAKKIIWTNHLAEMPLPNFIMEKFDEVIAYEKTKISSHDSYFESSSWHSFFQYQRLPESVIDKFEEFGDWGDICANQILSSTFIEEHSKAIGKAYAWGNIAIHQKLSEDFMEKWSHKLDWHDLAEHQPMSEAFIAKHKRKLTKINIETYQVYSDEFAKTHKLKPNLRKTREEKLEQIQKYAGYHGLKFDGEYLYAFREHDFAGRGTYKKTLSYEAGKYYRDWHCDLDSSNESSFGLGIHKQGNTRVRVKVEDWGSLIYYYSSVSAPKARVWGLEVLGPA